MECEPKGQQTSSDTYILFIEYRFCIHIQTSVNRDQISFVLPLRPVASEASVPLTLFSVEALIVRSCSISGLIFLWEQLVDTLMDKINIFLSFCCYPIITVNIQILSLNLFSKITRCPLNIFSFNVNLKICSFESCYLLKSSPTGALIINKGKLCRRVTSFVLKSCRQSWLFLFPAETAFNKHSTTNRGCGQWLRGLEPDAGRVHVQSVTVRNNKQTKVTPNQQGYDFYWEEKNKFNNLLFLRGSHIDITALKVEQSQNQPQFYTLNDITCSVSILYSTWRWCNRCTVCVEGWRHSNNTQFVLSIVTACLGLSFPSKPLFLLITACHFFPPPPQCHAVSLPSPSRCTLTAYLIVCVWIHVPSLPVWNCEDCIE